MIIHRTGPEPALLVYPDPSRLIRRLVFLGVFCLLLLLPSFWLFPQLGVLAGLVFVLVVLLLSVVLVAGAGYWNPKAAKERTRPSVQVDRAGITLRTMASRASFFRACTTSGAAPAIFAASSWACTMCWPAGVMRLTKPT